MTNGFMTSGAEEFLIRRHKRIEWAPQSDITAHELALLFPLLIAMAKDPLVYWEDFIPKDALRHFKISDQESKQ